MSKHFEESLTPARSTASQVSHAAKKGIKKTLSAVAVVLCGNAINDQNLDRYTSI